MERESITSLAVPGQWVLETSGGIWHNREPALALDYLLPDGRQGWSVQDDEPRRVGRFDPALLPSERDIARILDIGKELTNHLEQPSAWDGLTQVSPVMRNLDERARLQRLERDIERSLAAQARVQAPAAAPALGAGAGPNGKGPPHSQPGDELPRGPLRGLGGSAR